jgi:2-polyprenyl-6-methoxyphenol hydroxylase-like FAD-dependent oxidoreductase
MSSIPITIVGGGLAGLTLGIALRERDVPVTVWEAGHYPRHKVCGEFISGRGVEVLERMGLKEKLTNAGMCEARTVSFFSGSKASGPQPLPEPASCISRFKLDALLAEKFRSLKGELRENRRWSGDFGPSIVRATGRLASPVVDGWRWFGLKVHARNVALTTDLEMHFSRRGYVGLCRLDPRTVNICGLFRSETTVPDLNVRWREWLSGDPYSCLSGRLKEAVLDESSLCSTAALRISGSGFWSDPTLCLGDSIGVIPPVTGNGMSMAFESAEIAVEPLIEFSRQKISWTEAQKEIAVHCRKRLATRLRCASWVQHLLFQNFAREALFLTTTRHFPVWRKIFSLTR